MKRKTTILLSSILAGSLLVGGAFAAYAVTDKANPRVITVTPGTPVVPDKEVELNWGDNSTHQEMISNLAANTLVRAAHVSLVSDVQYTGLFTVALESETDEHDGENLIDNLEVYVYEGDVELEEGQIPEGAELAGQISKTTPKDTEGVKLFSLEVQTDSQTNPDYTVFVRIVVAEEKFGQLSNDEVTVTLDWGKGSENDYYVADLTPSDAAGFYLVGSFNNWSTYTEYKFATTETAGELKVQNVTIAANDELKVKQLTTGEAVWYPASGNVTQIPAGTYDILFRATYHEDWKDTSSYGDMFGKAGHFWFMPVSGDTPVTPDPVTPTYDDKTENMIWATTDGENWAVLTLLQVNPGNESEQMVTGLEIAKDTEFCVHLTGTTWVKAIKQGTQENPNAAANFSNNGTGNIVCNVAGTYNIYVDSNGLWIVEAN